MPSGRQSHRKGESGDNRGRIRKSSARGAARGQPNRGIPFKGAARGRDRPTTVPRCRVRELLPDLASHARASVKTSDKTPELAGTSHDEPAQPEAVQDTPAPKIERVYNDIWKSGPASFAFASHGKLDHNGDTMVIALNILDHIIRPENWNPDLSNNKLSASCFYFAAKLTDKKVTANQVAGSIWMDSEVIAGMSHATEGPLYDRMLESLTVSGEQVVQGYEILYEQRAGLRDLLGEYGKEIESLPSPATEKKLLESEVDDGSHASQIATEMMRLGYQRAGGLRVESGEVVDEAGDLVQAQNGACLKSVLEEGERTEVEELDLCDRNNEFEDFVAEHE